MSGPAEDARYLRARRRVTEALQGLSHLDGLVLVAELAASLCAGASGTREGAAAAARLLAARLAATLPAEAENAFDRKRRRRAGPAAAAGTTGQD